MRRAPALLLLLASALTPAAGRPLDPLEAAYADWRDAHHATDTVLAGSLHDVDGLDLAAWRARRNDARRRFDSLVVPTGLNAADTRALALMQADLAEQGADDSRLSQPATPADCEARRVARTEAALASALYACFATLGEHLVTADATLSRSAVLERLRSEPSARRREALWRSFEPLWTAIHGRQDTDSPYGRLLLATRAGVDAQGDRVDRASRTLGIDRATTEQWLTAALDVWARATAGAEVEPWDYWYVHAAASRHLDAMLKPAQITRVAAQYYHDLGADLARLGVVEDLEVRAGKAPLAYTDYIRIGRLTGSGWHPARVRVSARLERGGLDSLNELVHEDGHAVHMMALRTRPAFFDLGDPLFYEAFADVPAWSVATPEFAEHYLQEGVDRGAASEALFSGVALDMAWALFELRMLDDPHAEPNDVWTQITQQYLHIRPHPELAWWAVRVQLVHEPGYMINYGLGAVVTAAIRARTVKAIGSFDAGNGFWYPWLTQSLLSSGEALDSKDLLQGFLNGPVSVEPLLEAIGTVRGADTAVSAGIRR